MLGCCISLQLVERKKAMRQHLNSEHQAVVFILIYINLVTDDKDHHGKQHGLDTWLSSSDDIELRTLEQFFVSL